MASVPLRESITIRLNASGAGTAKVGPLSAREVWHPDNVAVHTNQASTAIVNESQCNVYVGSDTNTPNNFRDGCVDGSSGDATDKCNGDTLKCGDYVWAVWSGGDANVYATLTVTGTKDV
jgi:hypothetical protein